MWSMIPMVSCPFSPNDVLSLLPGHRMSPDSYSRSQNVTSSLGHMVNTNMAIASHTIFWHRAWGAHTGWHSALWGPTLLQSHSATLAHIISPSLCGTGSGVPLRVWHSLRAHSVIQPLWSHTQSQFLHRPMPQCLLAPHRMTKNLGSHTHSVFSLMVWHWVWEPTQGDNEPQNYPTHTFCRSVSVSTSGSISATQASLSLRVPSPHLVRSRSRASSPRR